MENLEYYLSGGESIEMEEGLRWFFKRLEFKEFGNYDDDELIDDMEYLIDFFFKYEDLSFFICTKEEYIHKVLHWASTVFINSHTELGNLSDSGKLVIYEFIRSEFLELISDNYDTYS